MRRLLTGGGDRWPAYLSAAEMRSLLHDPIAYPVARPNTPVLPFGATTSTGTYVDPTVNVVNGQAVVVSTRSFLGPYAILNASDGVVKVGGGSAILDNVTIIANPTHTRGTSVPRVLVGSQVEIGYGATILGPAAIGGYDGASKPTYVGPGAVIDGATIEPGAFVSALARVGPGVTVPAGLKVVPGANVTTNAEAADPALGKVTPVTAADLASLGKTLTANLQLAAGYITLYQGQSATGVNPAVPSTRAGVFNGNLSTILGANVQPGTSATFLPAGSAPKFPSPNRGLIAGSLAGFPARATGAASFAQRANAAATAVGRRNSIRADQGQPITVGSIARTGSGVTINAPNGGSLAIGQRFTAGDRAVILDGGAATKSVLGDDVTIGAGAVVQGSSLGAGTVVGPMAYLFDSTFPAGTQIPAGAIYVNNALVGYVAR